MLTLLVIAAVWLAPQPTASAAPGSGTQQTLAVTDQAGAPPGAAYPNDRVTTGEPIFLG